MQLYSTKNKSNTVTFKEALFRGLPPDNGLYMPSELPELPSDFIQNLSQYSFKEIAFIVAHAIQKDAIPNADLHRIINEAINFPAPVVKLDNSCSVLELFHGPSLAFKDFGARYMAQSMSYFNRNEDKELVILVATSGDTGGAVAFGFHKVPGIKVVILYPSGKVSNLQEKQLTTLGDNIAALEINGTFDDCQALVKQAFLDRTATESIRLGSANSINIARLIPQSFYYFEAYKQARQFTDRNIVFSVPSGNFGNLTAGLMAKRMGLPIHQFIAATNTNDIVPQYLSTGNYLPRPSEQTLSNAMDVGNPSNFARMQDLYGSDWDMIKQDITGYSINDHATEATMQEVFDHHSAYVMDPHGAVGYKSLKLYQVSNPDTHGIVLETAHPSKFIDDAERILGLKLFIPERLSILSAREKKSVMMDANYQEFKDWLMAQYG